MTDQYNSAQGVFDAEQILFKITDVVSGASTDSPNEVLLLGTPAGGLAVRAVFTVKPTSGVTTLTLTLTGSSDGSTADGEMIVQKAIAAANYPSGSFETLIPFTLPIEDPYLVMTIAQAGTPETLTGVVAGIVLDHKAVDWTRAPGWDTTATIPA